MNILVTAGNTQTPIDRVRCITNIFTGRTGTGIALHGRERGHGVTLLTSHPEVVADLARMVPTEHWIVRKYRTFVELHDLMQEELKQGVYDALVHCAAVSDYEVAGIYKPDKETKRQGDKETRRQGERDMDSFSLSPCLLVSLSECAAAGKVKSDESELWLRLVRTPKLIDLVRSHWRFEGIVVKFKLEVGISDEQLLQIAERSRRQSTADLMVANTLENANSWAFLGPLEGMYHRFSRQELAPRLLDEVERLHEEKSHG